MFTNPFQSSYHFNEFYEGMEDIKNSDYGNEGFGKIVNISRSAKPQKSFKKITSAQSFNGPQGMNGGIKKSSSSSTFAGNDSELSLYGKAFGASRIKDESTKDSHSPFSSVTSLSSMGSMQTISQKGSYMKPQGKKKPPTEADFKTKYKTEVCRYWAENGYCEFGEQCAFAHGDTEKRQKAFVAQNYKTKRCVAYHETGYCVYGVRCQFLHCYRKDCHFNPRLMYTNYADELEMVDIWIRENQDCECLRRITRPRLPIMQKLSLGELSTQEKF